MTTILYAGALGIVFLVLTMRVIQQRGSSGISLGDDGDTALIRRIRAHANFVEYTPLTLILIGLLEAQGLGNLWLHALGGALLVGRVMHGYAFSFTEHSPIGRSGGIALTLLSLAIASALALWMGIQAL